MDQKGNAKLYEYFGLIILFYSNEHDPIHVHCRYQGKESRAEIIFEDGKFVAVKISEVKGKEPLDPQNLKKFKKLVEVYRDDIVRRWVDFFVYNKVIEPERITKKYKKMVVSIQKAEYKGDYKIYFQFSDGIEQTIDFGDFLRNANNPMTKKYLDKGLFQSFIIEYGDIVWNDYEMCYPIWDLHEGKI